MTSKLACQPSVHSLCTMLAARHFLLLSLALYSFSTYACVEGGGGQFLGAVIFLCIFEAALIWLAYLGLWFTQKFWTAQSNETSGRWFYLFLFAALLTAIMLALIGIFAIPDFEALYASFNTELPSVTKTVISDRYLLVLALVAVAILWRWSGNKPRKANYFAYLLLFEMGLVLFVLWALYQPIFVMGCAW